MRSNETQLRKRGWVTADDLAAYKNLSEENLLHLLQSANPCKRTAGASLLKNVTPEITERLLQILSKETALYTKIAICEKLQTGDGTTAEAMIPYLAKIGSNQHYSLPEKPSKKVSYPLPRDIIARTLGRMSSGIITVLFEKASSLTQLQIREWVDAVGYLTFYHNELATEENLNKLITIVEKHKRDELIIWKFLTCLSVFPLPESRKILKEYAKQEGILGLEAQRSLKMIQTT